MEAEKKNNQGYITLFTSLLLMTLLVFILFVLELVYWRTGEVKAGQAATANIKSCFGEYSAEIFRDYHLFMLDVGLGTGSIASLEERLLKQLNENLSSKGQLFRLEAKEVMVTETVGIMDNHCEPLQAQIHEYCGYAMAEGLLDILKKKAQAPEPQTESKKDEQALKQEEMVDPRGMLNKLTGEALLLSVCPENRIPSKAIVSLAGLPSEKAGISDGREELSVDFFNEDAVKRLVEQPQVDLDNTGCSAGRLDLAFYIRSCFRTWLDSGDQRAFWGEQEYILYGNPSDRENVLAAVNDIILLRMPFNYLYLSFDASKKAILYSASTAIGFMLGSPPDLVRLFLTAAAAYGESVLDVRALLYGETVPLQKNDSTWRLSLSELFRGHLKGRTVKSGKNGLSYQDYLSLLALLKGKDQALCYRILDMITLNIQRERQGFTMDTMVTGLKLSYYISESPVFSMIPAGFNPEAYEFFYERKLSY